MPHWRRYVGNRNDQRRGDDLLALRVFRYAKRSLSTTTKEEFHGFDAAGKPVPPTQAEAYRFLAEITVGITRMNGNAGSMTSITEISSIVMTNARIWNAKSKVNLATSRKPAVARAWIANLLRLQTLLRTSGLAGRKICCGRATGAPWCVLLIRKFRNTVSEYGI